MEKQQEEQKTWHKEQRKWELERQKWELEQKSWQARTQATKARIKSELFRDGLIDDPEDFDFKISAKSLKVNGKKQSEALRQKYQDIIKESNNGQLEGEDWDYQIKERH